MTENNRPWFWSAQLTVNNEIYNGDGIIYTNLIGAELFHYIRNNLIEYLDGIELKQENIHILALNRAD